MGIPQRPYITYGFLTIGAAAALYLTTFYNYLLFHSIAEIFSITVAWMIFSFAWNARQTIANNYLLFLGIAYLFVGFIDLIHTLAFKGMGVFRGFDANLPTQLWIAARYLEGISLVLAPLFLTRGLNIIKTIIAYVVVVVLLFLSIFYWQVFPDCFLAETGLTAFKIISEYIICLILTGALLALLRNKDHFDSHTLRLLAGAIITTIIAELAFTYYIGVYDISNMIGHYFKIISFYLVYRAIIAKGIREPYSLIFRRLKEKEEALLSEQGRLKEALEQVKVLRGLIPICSSCKKIRDDRGYWQQFESYILKHSEVEFTHGICPSCMEKLYPEFKDKIL